MVLLASKVVGEGVAQSRRTSTQWWYVSCSTSVNWRMTQHEDTSKVVGPILRRQLFDGLLNSVDE